MTKTGTPCGYRVYDTEFCPHHDPDKTRQEELLEKAQAGRIVKTIPDEIEIDELSTSKDIQYGFQQVIKIGRASCRERV